MSERTPTLREQIGKLLVCGQEAYQTGSYTTPVERLDTSTPGLADDLLSSLENPAVNQLLSRKLTFVSLKVIERNPGGFSRENSLELSFSYSSPDQKLPTDVCLSVNLDERLISSHLYRENVLTEGQGHMKGVLTKSQEGTLIKLLSLFLKDSER